MNDLIQCNHVLTIETKRTTNLTRTTIDKMTMQEQPIFTRYLYVVEDVWHSLKQCFRHCYCKTLDEVLFWTFELQCSGFEKELLHFLEEEFTDYNFVIEENEPFCVQIANIMANLFIQRKNEVWCMLNPQCEKPKKFMVVKINKTVVRNYVKILQPDDDLSSHELLRNKCRFKTEKCKHTIYTREELTHMFRNNWLFYSCYTPVWKKRVEKYGGHVDYEKKCVVFDNEENEERFRVNYDYEPDEQPLWLFDACIGNACDEIVEFDDGVCETKDCE